MNVRESASIALAALQANKLRSLLTLLGVIIGVAAVVAVMSLVQGLNQYVAKQLTSSGSNVFSVDKVGLAFDAITFRDRMRRADITRAQVAAIARSAPHVAAATAERDAAWPLSRGRTRITGVAVRGVEPGYMDVNDLPVATGRVLAEFDENGRRNTCVIGADVADQLFGGLDPLGQDMRVGDQRFTVVGVGERKGSAFGQSRDLYVLIPLGTFERMDGRVGSVQIQVRSHSPNDFEQAQDETRAILRAVRHVRPGAPDDFELVTPDMLLDLWRNLSSAIFVVIIGVSVISLVVGGIVIMNIMLVSVTERTREIGIRKALGARRSDVRSQFLIEAVTLSSVGGVIGLALGIAFALLIGVVSPLPVFVSPFSIVLGLAMAMLVGVFFGSYPAIRAARLDPIDALRYE